MITPNLTWLRGNGVASRDPTAKLKTILVPVDGSNASMEAVAIACNLGKRNKGRVFVVNVIEVPLSLPLDADLPEQTAEGEDILRRAQEIAEQQDFEIQDELLQARRAGEAIVDEARERNVDALIIGLGAEGSHGTFQLGKVPQYALHNAPCQVIVWRQTLKTTR
jgi:nucleotide-binding universal stress UspA family protein